MLQILYIYLNKYLIYIFRLIDGILVKNKCNIKLLTLKNGLCNEFIQTENIKLD